MTIREPVAREDGRCVVCRQPCRPERSRRYAGYEAEKDPFCCTEHARLYFGCPLPARANAKQDAA
jgi:hypothetical protein